MRHFMLYYTDNDFTRVHFVPGHLFPTTWTPVSHQGNEITLFFDFVFVIFVIFEGRGQLASNNEAEN